MPVDKSPGLRCEQIVVSTGFYARKNYPEKLRRVKFVDSDKELQLILITNQMTLSAFKITEFCRCRLQVEIFLNSKF